MCSLIEELAKIDQESYKSALGNAIIRLSRVSMHIYYLNSSHKDGVAVL